MERRQGRPMASRYGRRCRDPLEKESIERRLRWLIERSGCLVEEEIVWDVQDRASQAEALLFAQRQYAVPMSFLLKPPHQRAQPDSHDHVGQPLGAKGFRL